MADTPQQYYTKPKACEAWQINLDNIKELAKWCSGRVQGHTVVFPKIRHRGQLLTPGSRESKHYATVGDYVVKTSNGFVRVTAEEFHRDFLLGSSRIQV